MVQLLVTVQYDFAGTQKQQKIKLRGVQVKLHNSYIIIEIMKSSYSEFLCNCYWYQQVQTIRFWIRKELSKCSVTINTRTIWSSFLTKFSPAVELQNGALLRRLALYKVRLPDKTLPFTVLLGWRRTRNVLVSHRNHMPLPGSPSRWATVLLTDFISYIFDFKFFLWIESIIHSK